MSQKTTHILYSGLGGHGEYVFSLIGDNQQNNNSVLFFGVEHVREDYIKLCESRNIEWDYVQKTSDFSWVFNLIRYYKSKQKNVFVIHSSIAILPFILLWKRKKIIYVEHQSNKLKSRMDWFCSFISEFVANKRIFITESSLKEVKEKLGFFFQNKGCEILTTGIDMNFWQKKSTSEIATEDPIRLGMQGRLVPIKNFSCLIKTLPIIQTHFSKKKFELHIAGEGEDRKRLEQLIIELKLEHCVHFHGNLNRDSLLLFMQSLSLYIHSTKGETLSTSILQAMAMKIPIIASNVEGVSNLLLNGVDALLFAENDEYSLADCVINLLDSKEKQASLVELSYQKVLRKHSLEVMRENFNQILLHV